MSNPITENTTDTDSKRFERVAVIEESDFPGDWDDEDIAVLAKFLADHDLGNLTRILDPESDMDYSLYVPVDTQDDEDDSDSTSPFDPDKFPDRDTSIDVPDFPGPVQQGSAGVGSGGRSVRGEDDE